MLTSNAGSLLLETTTATTTAKRRSQICIFNDDLKNVLRALHEPSIFVYFVDILVLSVK